MNNRKEDLVRKDSMTIEQLVAELEAGKTIALSESSYSSEYYSMGDLRSLDMLTQHSEFMGDTYFDRWHVVTADISVMMHGKVYTQGMKTARFEHDVS